MDQIFIALVPCAIIAILAFGLFEARSAWRTLAKERERQDNRIAQLERLIENPKAPIDMSESWTLVSKTLKGWVYDPFMDLLDTPAVSRMWRKEIEGVGLVEIEISGLPDKPQDVELEISLDDPSDEVKVWSAKLFAHFEETEKLQEFLSTQLDDCIENLKKGASALSPKKNI